MRSSFVACSRGAPAPPLVGSSNPPSPPPPRPPPLTKDDALIIRRLLAVRTDAALREFIEPSLAAHATLAAQCERIWARLYLDGGTITRDRVRLTRPPHRPAPHAAR